MTTTASDYAWHPTSEQIASANLTQFMQSVGVADYGALLRYVEGDLAGFNEKIVKTLDLQWDKPWTSVLDRSRGKAFATWFAGAEFNAPANCLDRHIAAGRGAADALVWEGEDGAIRRYTFAELRAAVARLAGALRSLGVHKGDTVGIFMSHPRDGHRSACHRLLRRNRGPRVLRLRPRRALGAPGRCAREGALDGRRRAPPRQTRDFEIHRR